MRWLRRTMRGRLSASKRLLLALAGGGFLWPGAAESQPADLEPIFSTGFETGTLNDWRLVSDYGGDLAVTAAAALIGSFGLQAVVNDATALYVQEDLMSYPSWPRNRDESYFHVSFRFDPNGFDPGEAQGSLRTRVFIAFEQESSRRLFALVLRRRQGQYALMARVRQDDNSQVDTGFFDIADDTHLVEMAWNRARGADTQDGLFRLAIDGVEVSVLQGLDNADDGVDFTRLGVMSLKAGANGTLYWDDFRSFRDLGAARAQLVINEVDYDQPGDDTREFVEIYNPGPAPVATSGGDGIMHIAHIDGATHYEMAGYFLGPTLAPGQYLVIATPGVSAAPGALRLNFPADRDVLGNGAPDGIVLVYQRASDCVVLDAVSYEGVFSAPLPPCGLINLVEGTPLSPNIEDSDVIAGSLSRIPNASDTDDAATDWNFSSSPTPGSANVP